MQNLEDQVRRYREIGDIIEELEQEKKFLSTAILEQMLDKKERVAEFTVRKVQRLTFKTSLEEARSLLATKTEEVVDKDKLKELYLAGTEVPGATTHHFLNVSLKTSDL